MLKDIEDIRKAPDKLTKEAIKEIKSELPPSFRGRIVLKGPLIEVQVRVAGGSITYVFSGVVDPLGATPLALFLHGKAVKINRRSIAVPVTRAAKSEVINADQIDGDIVVRIKPIW